MTELIVPQSAITRRTVHFGARMHRLDDHLVSVGLADQLCTEYGDSWYAIATFASGGAFCFGKQVYSPTPGTEVLEKMLACARSLNSALHHDGCWIVVWHLDHLSFMWRDGEGDAAFIVQVNEPWHRIRMWTAIELTERAEAAWNQWHEMMTRVLQRRPEETIKRALGQPGTPERVH